MQLSDLRKPCKAVTVENITKDKDVIVSILGNMNKYILDNKIRGIAANQLGSHYRMLCYVDNNNEIVNCINPEIIQRHSQVHVTEFDPSFPNLICKVERSNKVKVKYLSVKGSLTETEVTLKNEIAFVFQKCFDLLNGTVIFDKGIPVNWLSKYPKIYEVAYLNDYFVEGENKLWFAGTEIDSKTVLVKRVAGIKVFEKLNLEGEIAMTEAKRKTAEEIKDLLESEYGNQLLNDSQKKFISDETTPDIFDEKYEGEVPSEETDRNAIAWLYGRIPTDTLLGLDGEDMQEDAKPVENVPTPTTPVPQTKYMGGIEATKQTTPIINTDEPVGQGNPPEQN